MAVSSLKEIHRELGIKNPVAKISSEKLNKRGISAVADMLAGKDLIIQHAAGLTDAVQNELDDLMEKDRSGMIVVLIDTPENLEALHAHNTSLASKFQYIGSDENASAQKEADTEMEAALKRSTEKQEQIARDVVNAEQETEEEPEQEDAEALQEEPEYEKEETDILEESSEPETDEEDEEEPEPEEYVPPKKAKLFAKQEKPQKKVPVTEEEPELPEETASAAEEEVVPEDYDDKEEMDPDEFAQYACKYATEIDCSITGKSMLAKRLPSILPDMTRQESLQTTEVYSVAGMTDPAHPLVTQRPFRSPHHTASPVSLSGGGTVPRPGEISLAHNGILFLDELPEFDKTALETLRQPLEDGVVTITRVSGSLTLPSRFMLVCAMNPCRCGWYGHPSGRCTCSESQVESYMRRISGPLLDRIDMHIEVPSVEYEAMRRKEKPETSAQVRARVNAARELQKQRFSGTGVSCNAYMTPAMIGQYCLLDAAGERLMKGAFDRLGLTGRSHDRILRMARTIADLDASPDIQAAHLAEAIQYRSSTLLK